MRAANCVQFCQNPFCREVQTDDSDKTVHNLQLTSAWIRSWKTRTEHYILLFSLFYTIKEIFLVFMQFFHAVLFIKFPTHVTVPIISPLVLFHVILVPWKSGVYITGSSYIILFCCLSVEPCLYSDAVFLSPIEPATWVWFPAGAGWNFFLFDIYMN